MEAVGAGVSAAGSLMGAMGGNDVSTNIPIAEMNATLDKALNSGLKYSEKYTGKAVDAQNTALTQALQQLKLGQNALTTGFAQSQALQAPYRDQGYQALDSYADSLMQARPTMGARAYADIQNKEATTQGVLRGIGINQQDLNSLTGEQNWDPYKQSKAPTLRGIAEHNVTDGDINNYIKDNISEAGAPQTPGWGMYSGAGASAAGNHGDNRSSYGTDDIHNMAPGLYGSVGNLRNYLGVTQDEYGNAVSNELAKPLFQQAQNLYGQQSQAYSQLNDYLTNQYTNEQQRQAMAINQGLFGPAVRTQIGIPK